VIILSISEVCQKCIELDGGCCSNVILVVHSSELEPFRDRFENKTAPANHLLLPDMYNPNHFSYNSKGDRCMFLGDNTLCTIYSQRPLICRLYPLKYTRSDDLHVHLTCPLAHLIPLHEIGKWADLPENQELIKQGQNIWGFNSQTKRYASISNLKRTFIQLAVLNDVTGDREVTPFPIGNSPRQS